MKRGRAYGFVMGFCTAMIILCIYVLLGACSKAPVHEEEWAIVYCERSGGVYDNGLCIMSDGSVLEVY